MMQVDFRRLIIWLLPVRLRTKRQVAWLQVLTAPLQNLCTLFGSRRAANLYLLGITPQVYCMEKMLNDRYDTALRRIRIADSSRMQRVYVFLQNELKPVYLSLHSEAAPVYFGTMAEMEAREADFTVSVPYTVTYSPQDMRGLLDTCKLPGRAYDIVTTI